jgi:hypothetical protein
VPAGFARVPLFLQGRAKPRPARLWKSCSNRARQTGVPCDEMRSATLRREPTKNGPGGPCFAQLQLHPGSSWLTRFPSSTKFSSRAMKFTPELPGFRKVRSRLPARPSGAARQIFRPETIRMDPSDGEALVAKGGAPPVRGARRANYPSTGNSASGWTRRASSSARRVGPEPKATEVSSTNILLCQFTPL